MHRMLDRMRDCEALRSSSWEGRGTQFGGVYYTMNLRFHLPSFSPEQTIDMALPANDFDEMLCEFHDRLKYLRIPPSIKSEIVGIFNSVYKE